MVPDKAMEFGIWWDLEFPLRGRQVPAVHPRGASKGENDVEWGDPGPQVGPQVRHDVHSGQRGSGKVASPLGNVAAGERQAGSWGHLMDRPLKSLSNLATSLLWLSPLWWSQVQPAWSLLCGRLGSPLTSLGHRFLLSDQSELSSLSVMLDKTVCPPGAILKSLECFS